MAQPNGYYIQKHYFRKNMQKDETCISSKIEWEDYDNWENLSTDRIYQGSNTLFKFI